MESEAQLNIITPELLDAFMTNHALIDALLEGSNNELVIINNDCNINCQSMPIMLKTLLCDVKIYIGNSGTADIEINKLENKQNEDLNKLYKMLIDKYFKDYQHTIGQLEINNEYTVRMNDLLNIHRDLSSRIYKAIADLIDLYLKMDNSKRLLFESKTEIITLKTTLTEKENVLRILHRVKTSNSNRIYKYLAITRRQMYEIKKQLSHKEISIRNKMENICHIINSINEEEIRLFCLLSRMNELSMEI